MKPVNLAEKLSTFTEYWQPRTVGEFNGHDLMVVKVKGAFVWHKHDGTDDFFLVLKGESPFRCAPETSASVPERRSWCRRASSIVPWLRRNLTCS
jgi:mannose-6-phosphate isomerase-like protein (cupin superfamily)